MTTRLAAACLVAASWLPLAYAAPPSPELQQRIRATTFEVVVRKSEPADVQYEKALPLELIPYAERTDQYWSIGTAFALAPGVFASAAHVINASFGSPFGVPSLRDAKGSIFEVERILKYSLEEDFVVFSVRDAPAVTPLEVRRDFALDTPVFAVGNALGEGVIVRDGLLTSSTPEAREGRWQWLRFSAATSPGNSGGPLLDSGGRVLGIVIGKSPNENLNYALPIRRVLDDPGRSARFDVRASFSLPILRDAGVSDFSMTIPLPIGYAEFERRYVDARLAAYEHESSRLLAAQADVLLPRGDSAKLLATLHEADTPGLAIQQDDGAWGVDFGTGRQETTLPNGTRFRIANGDGLTLFRMQVPGAIGPNDDKAFMDDLLKALRLPRLVGTQPIRITSLGRPARTLPFSDRWTRPWQIRIWPLGYMDLSVLVADTPAPDGALGIVRLSPGQEVGATIAEFKLLADYFYSSYSGSMPQWRAFLGSRAGNTRLFEKIEWHGDESDGFRYRSPTLEFQVPASALAVTDASTFDLRPTYVLQGERLDWQVAGLRLSQDAARKTSFSLTRAFPPPASASPDQFANWTATQQRSGRYSGSAQRDNDFDSFWVRTAVGGGETATYELLYQTNRQLVPRELEEIRDQLLRGIRVTGR